MYMFAPILLLFELFIYKCLSFLWRATCKVRQDDGVAGEQRARLVQSSPAKAGYATAGRMTMFGGEQRARFVQSSPAKAGYATAGRMTMLLIYFVYPSYGEQRARLVRMTINYTSYKHFGLNDMIKTLRLSERFYLP